MPGLPCGHLPFQLQEFKGHDTGIIGFQQVITVGWAPCWWLIRISTEYENKASEINYESEVVFLKNDFRSRTHLLSFFDWNPDVGLIQGVSTGYPDQ
jgi:hypothetical protein